MKDGSDRVGNIAWIERRGCHLIMQRLKEMVIASIDQSDFNGCIAQRPGRIESPKKPSDDDDVLPGGRLTLHE